MGNCAFIPGDYHGSSTQFFQNVDSCGFSNGRFSSESAPSRIQLPQDRVQWRAFVIMVMNLQGGGIS